MSMMVGPPLLPLTIRPRAFEPGHAAMARLASRWGATKVFEFSRQRGLPFTDLAAGRRIDDLAACTGLDPIGLVAASPLVSAGARTVRLQGQTFRLGDWSTRSRRRCPICLDADIREAAELDLPAASWATSAAWWDVRSITTCPFHQVRLVDHCAACGEQQGWDHPLLSCPCTAGHGLGSVQPQSSAVSTYIVGRLSYGRSVQVPILDAMRLDDAIRCMELLGAASLPWSHTKPRRDNAATDADRERGYLIAADWPQAFHASLDGLVKSRPEAVGLIETYGWLYNDVCVGDARAVAAKLMKPIIRENAVRNKVMARDEDRLCVDAPITITATASAKLLNRSYAVARRLLDQAGAIPSGSRRSVSFAIDPDHVARLRSDRATATQSFSLRVGKKQARRIVSDIDIATALERGSDDRASALMSALAGKAAVPLSPELVPLPTACRDMSVALERACVSALQGNLRIAKCGTTDDGLYGFAVDPSDLRKLRPAQSSVGIEEVARRCKFHPETARYLMISGAFGDRDESGLVEASAVDDFMSKHILASHVARSRNTSSRALREALAQGGIVPTHAPPLCRQLIYRRSDLPSIH